MKNILVILFFSISYSMFAQSDVEQIVKKKLECKDSSLYIIFNVYTEGCQKLPVKYGAKNDISCPVYWDTLNRYGFYVGFTNKRLYIEEIPEITIEYFID